MKNRICKNFISMAVIILFLMAFGTVNADAATYDKNIADGSIMIKDSESYVISGTTEKHHITVEKGNPTITIRDLTIDLCNEQNDDKSVEAAPISIKKDCDVTLIVEGSVTLYGGNHTGIGANWGYAGINIDKGAKLTIKGNSGDKLIVYGGGNYGGSEEGGAAIGSDADNDMGSLTINGNLAIDAHGAVKAAGIGSGCDTVAGDITINGGTITAAGGRSAAGIGCGDSVGGGDGGNGNNITIHGGTINATGGSGAAGIGGSDGGDVKGTIKISDGNVTAAGGENGAGIGGSLEGYVSAIKIEDGVVHATGGKNGAGIGGGNAKGGGDGGDVGEIYISGGTITAYGGGGKDGVSGTGGAGIGEGDGGEIDQLKIYEGKPLNITAYGGSHGAGIGSATGEIVSHNIDTIMITLNGGTIKAVGGSQGAGIGGGNTTVKNIFLYGKGTIDATGTGEGAAIGAGEGEDGGNITIKGHEGRRGLCITARTVNSERTAVIGGSDSDSEDITLCDAQLNLSSQPKASGQNVYGAAIGNGRNTGSMGDIYIENCGIEDASGSERVGATIGTGWCADVGNITIKKSDIKGGTIGSVYSNDLIREIKVDSITIEDSDVEAINESSQKKAAIGAGEYTEVKKITIKDSKIHAESRSGAGIGAGGYNSDSTGDPVRWTGGKCGNVNITGSEITAIGRDGGAGIGGGWGNSVDDITITDSTVTAQSSVPRRNEDGGAGIGGGFGESAGTIKIENSKVSAEGAGYGAGIGSGGMETMGTTVWNTTCHTIQLKNSTVTAKGGKKAAGIGTGCGAQFGSSAYIDIEDCTVEATGGEKAAGIGAGANGYFGSGAEAHDIYITGKSKINAKGGDGGAGIGGGFGGGADTVKIDLEETVYDVKAGDWKYYVKAEGGYGGAGIGGGGEHGSDSGNTAGTAGHGADSIQIKGGYVYARGGSEKSGSIDYAGAAAGIGGGGRGGRLEDFVVTGGYIVAQAGNHSGSSTAANDIGSGGNDVKPLVKDGDAKISGGTVLGGLSSEFDIKIDGGSVSHNTTAAKRSDGTKVYRTRMQTGESCYKPDNLKVSLQGYGTTDIISDDNGVVYFYLTATSDEKGSTADYTDKDNNSRHYYGKTMNDGSSWIKMDGSLIFEKPETDPVVGEPFPLSIKGNAGIPDGTEIEFSLEDNPNIEIVEEDTVTMMPGAKVCLKASDRTEYTVNAKAKSGSEMYWDAEGSYSDRVTKRKGTIDITENPSKVYDGQAVENPSVDTNSDGKVTYRYFNESGGTRGTELDKAPKNAGSYIVQVTAAATDHYSEAVAEKAFTIEKRPVVLDINASENEGNATVTVTMIGAVDDPGEVNVSVKSGGADVARSVRMGTPDRNTGISTGSVSFENVAGDQNYNVRADYEDNQGNYTCTNDPVEKTFYKNKAKRNISVNNLNAVYGDDDWDQGGKIEIDYGSTGAKGGDAVSFEQLYDDGTNHYNLERTATVDDKGHVTYRNAGAAVVKVTVTNDAYEAATAYSVIRISRADLSVTSYAYKGDDIESNRLESITYGSIDDSIQYGLTFEGLKLNDSADSFAHGTLEAVPLNETAAAGEAEIGIMKRGASVTLNGKNYDVFLSRNYALKLVPGKVEIIPSVLYIKADDKTGIYGTEPDYTYTLGEKDGSHGLMAWDKPEAVIESVGTPKAYEKYKPGVHKECIMVKTKSAEDGNGNYVFTDKDGRSTIVNGDLTVKKADVTISAEIPSKVYDGKPIEVANVSVTPVAQIPADKLHPCQTPSIKYYEISDEAGAKPRAISAPKDAGDYKAVISVAEDDYYTGASKVITFTIRKAHCDVKTPTVPDLKMRDGLKLSDQSLPTGWKWLDPDKKLEVGSVSGYAVYTPADTRNYYKEIRTIGFTVYKEDPASGESGGSGSDNHNGSGTRTGDETDLLVWIIAATLALTAAVVAARRRSL